MSKPVILQLRPLPDWDQAPLDASFDCKRLFDATEPDTFLAEHGPAVRAIATGGAIGASAAQIAACPNLELIAVYGVGFDAVDLNACRARGIRVTNTPDVLTNDVADLAIAMMMAHWRGLIGAESWVRDGSWARKGAYPLQRRVHGKNAGILGLGRIGQAVAKRLAGFDMAIAYSDVDRKNTPPDWAYLPDPLALASHADVLFVTLAATADTRHIVNASVMQALGPDGLLVNVSRAANLDEGALIECLTDGTLGAAALDVFAGEPAVDPRLMDAPNLLMQPHHASGTIETRKDMGQLMRANLTAHFAGQPLLTPVL